MARRHVLALRELLEQVAYDGFAVTSKELLLRAYGKGQRRITVAVRNFIREEWDVIRDEAIDELQIDIEDTELMIAITPAGKIVIIREELFKHD